MLTFLTILGASDERGWVSVERPQQSMVQPLIDESSTSWPVFVRQFGPDRVIIRFPDEPVYTYPYVEQGDLETMYIEVATADGFHRLLVESLSVDMEAFIQQRKINIASMEDALLVAVDPAGGNAFDFLYRSDKKWVRERIIASVERCYVLQTVSETFNEASHAHFLNSFDLEIRDENKVFHREIQSNF